MKDAKKTLAEKRYQVEHGELGKADKVLSMRGMKLGYIPIKFRTSKKPPPEPTSTGLRATSSLLLAIVI